MALSRFRRAASSISVLLACLVCFIGDFPAQAEEPGLDQAGYGGGGRFTAAAVDPSNPEFVLIGSDVAGFFVSRDGGDSFTPKGAGLDGLAVSAFAFDPARPGTFAVQCDEGLYLTRDGGERLTLVSRELGYGERFFGSALLLPVGEALIAATPSSGAFSVSWRDAEPKITPLPGLEGRKINSLALYSGELFAAASDGAYRLENGRFTAESQGLPPGAPLEDMAASPASGLFALSREEGLYRFDPAAKTWSRPGSPPSIPGEDRPLFGSVALDPSRPGRVFLAAHPEYWPYALFVSEDGGASWTRAQTFTMAPDAPPNWTASLEAIEDVAFSPDGQTCFVTDWWNLWRSRDGGKTFTQIHRGLQNTVVYDIERVPGRPGELLVATADNGLMVSDDAGATWRRSMRGVPDGNVRAVRASPANPDKRYLLVTPFEGASPPEGTVSISLCKSVDGGATWEHLPFLVLSRSLPDQADGAPALLAIDPANDDAVYVGTNGHGLFRVDVPLLEAGDADAAVKNVSRGMPEPCFYGSRSLLVFPEAPGRLLAATLGGGVMRSDDGGRFWTPMTQSGLFVYSLAADPGRPGRVLAGLPEKRLMLSDDYGETWKEIDLPGERPPNVAAQSVAADPSAAAGPGALYAGTASYDLRAGDGLFASLDGGETFLPVPADMARVGVTVLSPGPGGLLVGYNGLGVFRLTGVR